MQVDIFTVESIVSWMQKEFAQRKKRDAVVGLSGGIDSAVVASLCVRAGLKVEAVAMPSPKSNRMAEQIAQRLASRLDASFNVVAIAPNPMNGTPVGYGNMCARLRMCALYDVASLRGGLVVGTSNKSEILLGYGTRHGDTACDIAPLANVYKTEVYELAKLLDVPQEIIDAKPTADLWPGQTDEGELGFSYADADRYFQFGTCGIEATDAKIAAQVAAMAFKNEPVPAWRW